MKKAMIGILGAAALGALLWWKSQWISAPGWEQPTMGTVCHVTLAQSVRKSDLAALRATIDAALADVNARMSIWSPDTEISRFNALNATEPFPVSPEFASVVQSALMHAEQTGGAFDPTVKPLVDYWGFGPGRMSNIEHGLSNDEPAQIMKSVGWQKLRLENNTLIKLHPALQLDLAAIAKGYGVDRVAEVIRAGGYSRFLVEIGGEIVASGNAPSGKPWRIGIETPDPDAAFGEKIFRVLELSDMAMATSGDYRNFRRRDDGTRYSHLINPHTGKPAETDVAAVTVLAERCMDADAAATALFVMGSEAGLAWTEAHPGYEAFFILHRPDGGFDVRASSGFPSR